MKTMNKHLLALGFAFGLMFAATHATAGDGVSVLDDAIQDYAGQAPTSEMSQGRSVDPFETNATLDGSYYDWPLENYQHLEEAEIAAFEVPDVLRVHD